MTLVFTTAFNRPDFIALQHRLFARFLLDDYQFVVISDADTEARQRSIRETCDRLGVTCHQVPSEIHDRPYLHRSPGDNYHNPNVRHCNSVQWAWDTIFARHHGPVMVIDSDMFLIRPFSVEQTLVQHHLAGVYWGADDARTGAITSYLWLALLLLNNPRLPERQTICFNCGLLPATATVCDSGGWTYLYLNKHKETLKVRALGYEQGQQFFCPFRYASAESQQFDHLSADEISGALRARGFSTLEIELVLKKPYTIELLADNHFLHYRAGTNYEHDSAAVLSRKDRILAEFFEQLLRSPHEST